MLTYMTRDLSDYRYGVLDIGCSLACQRDTGSVADGQLPLLIYIYNRSVDPF